MTSNSRWLCVVLVAVSVVGIPSRLFADQGAADAPDVSELLSELKSASPEQQVEIVIQLGRYGPYAYPALESLLADLDQKAPVLQYECLVAIGHIGPLAHDAAERLTPFLSSDSEALQSAALESLRRLGTASPEAVSRIRTLTTAADASIATSAVRCLLVVSVERADAINNAIPRLITALSDDRAEVRNEAAVALREIGPDVLPAITSSLSSSDARVRTKACAIVGGLGRQAENVVPGLVALLEDEDPVVVRAAALALGEIHSQPALVLPALRPMMVSKSLALRITAVRVIGEYGPAAGDLVPEMLSRLSADSAVLRAAATKTLGLIGDASPTVIGALVKRLSDGDGTVTVCAANALSQLGSPAVPALIEKLSDAPYSTLIAEVLGEMGAQAEAAVPALTKLVHSDDHAIQREAFIALAMIGPHAAAATPEMLKILEDPAAGDARAGAAYVLANIGEKKCLPVLKRILGEEKNEKVLRASAWALVKLDAGNSENVPVVLPYLIKATSSEIPLARKEAITALGDLGAIAREAMPFLLEHAKSDEDSAVRAEALHALAEMKPTAAEAMPVAFESLDDPDPLVRNSARFLLGRLGTEAHGAASALRESLQKGDAFERVVSAWALVNVDASLENTKAAIPVLIPALAHPNPQVREEVAMTLGAVGQGSKDVLAALEQAKDDSDPVVKDAVNHALEAIRK